MVYWVPAMFPLNIEHCRQEKVEPFCGDFASSIRTETAGLQ